MPITASSREVSAYLSRVTPAQRRIIMSLRRLIRHAAPDTAETVLWDSLSYHRPSFGGRIKGAVCLLTAKQDCVHLGFIHGAALTDRKHLLRGAAKYKRVVVIRDARDIDTRAFAELITAANRYDPRQKA